jgi:hypothetical protein
MIEQNVGQKAGIFNLVETMVGITSLQRNAHFIERSSIHGSVY